MRAQQLVLRPCLRNNQFLAESGPSGVAIDLKMYRPGPIRSWPSAHAELGPTLPLRFDNPSPGLGRHLPPAASDLASTHGLAGTRSRWPASASPPVATNRPLSELVERGQFRLNVRELERVMERAVALAGSEFLELDDLPPGITGGFGEVLVPSLRSGDTMRAWGSRYARLVLERCQNNKRRACRELGISYHTLRAYLRFRPELSSPVELDTDDVSGP